MIFTNTDRILSRPNKCHQFLFFQNQSWLARNHLIFIARILSLFNGNVHWSWIITTTPYLRTLPLVLCCKLFTWYMYQHLPVGTCINTYLYKILLSFWQIKWMPPHLGTKSTNMHISLIWKLIIEIHFKHPTIEELIHSSFQFKSIEIKSYIKENQWPDSIGHLHSVTMN